MAVHRRPAIPDGLVDVVLGTDYPFAVRETPPGSVLADVDLALRAAIGRDNALTVLDPVHIGATP